MRWILGGVVYIGIGVQSAQAFQIRTPETEACHERITLSAIDVLGAVYANDDGISGDEILQPLFELARSGHDQMDKGTKAFANEVADRFHLEFESEIEKFVVASFVAGVRFPDTDGLAVVKFNETRSIHIRDDNQIKHSLRRSTHKGEEGNEAAVIEFRQHIWKLAEAAHKLMLNKENGDFRTRWTFPYYGETNIYVHGPSFLLGQIAHTIQDSYAHAIRDEDMRLLAVGNYVNIVRGNHNEDEDGPGHSERVDECNMEDEFDASRFREAAKQSAALFSAIVESRDNEVFTPESIEPVLSAVFNLREGCVLSNSYCDAPWFQFSQQKVTEPISINYCGVIGTTAERGFAGSICFLILPFLFALKREYL